MSHVLFRTRVPDGMMFTCECGRLMAVLKRPYIEDSLEQVLQGHRLHVYNSLELLDAWRVGSTTQITDQVDPLKV
jgi:hypothetical protein